MAMTLPVIAEWAFKKPHRLKTLLSAKSPAELLVAVNKIDPNNQVTPGDPVLLELWNILNNDGSTGNSTLVNGRPVLHEVHRLWLLTPHNSPRTVAKVDPWKGYT